MTALLKRILPISLSNRDVDDDYNVEYSFAMEYTGPPVTYDLPRVVPIDVDRIPTAAVAATASMLTNLSLPVIQPVAKSDPLKLGIESAVSPLSGINSREFDGLAAVGLPDSHNTSSNSVDAIDNPGELCLANGDERRTASDVTESSGSLGFSDSRGDDSHELSGSSDVEDLPRDLDNLPRVDLGNDLDLSSPALSSEISTCEEEDCIEEAPSNGNINAIVTFSDPESDYTVSEETDYNESEIIPERPVAKSNVKKGLCHRCLKGNRFTEKEVCIVCSAKYCSDCVVRAMGSMPEGRKCVTCIGYRIDESKRGALGKCSRMLKRLLTDWEVKQIMKFEISCEVNQVPPQLVCVNDKPLCHDEMILLQSCKNPPKRLKPGKYWYDKVSGLWGKEGQKPCQIISPQLAVGNAIMRNASNGNTNILINNREITQPELFMLKIAGIRCEGNPHFWVSADGSFQEEGQKNVKGKIWDRTGTKLISAVLSLPIPSKSANSCGEGVDNSADKAVQNYLDQKTLNKFLLVGYDGSGTSTIFKQAKILYNVPFAEDERQNVKSMIQSNMYGYLGILLEGREQFEEECSIEMRKKQIDQPGPSENSDQIGGENIYSISSRLKAFSDWLHQVMMSGNLEAIFPAATREYAPRVEELWNDRAFQATYSRRNELNRLPRVANYFLDRVAEIVRTDYEPSDMDLLYADGITSSNGIGCMEFSFPKSVHDSFMDPTDQNDPLPRYQLIRAHSSSLGENCKWLEMFEDVDLVLYCVSLTDYDQFVEERNGVSSTNKMLASKKLFESIVTHSKFVKKDFLLILNKFDLMEEKIEQVPLTQCDWFCDFNPVISYHPNGGANNNNNNNPSLAQRASHYIAVKFKRLFRSLTGRKLYVSMVTGLEPDSVDEALKYGNEVLKWDERLPSFNMDDDEGSSASVEGSTSS